MTAESARFGALSTGVLVIAVALAGAWHRSRSREAATPDPVVGRAAEAIARDPAGSFAHVRRTSAEEADARRRRLAAESLDRDAGPVAWPGPWHGIVIHALPGPLPRTSGEEGPPWHAVVREDGGVDLSARLRAGRPGVPDGHPVAEGRKCLHIMVPRAPAMTDGRREALASVVHWLRNRLGIGPEKVLLAGEKPGTGVPPPPGVTRASILPAESGR